MQYTFLSNHKPVIFYTIALSTMLSLSACDQNSHPSQTEAPEVASTASLPASAPTAVQKTFKPNVSQQFIGSTEVDLRLAEALPEIPYQIENLTTTAQQVNQASWQINSPLNEATIIKIQALLNWHHHKVGAVDGKMNKNVIKAMQAFQQAHQIPLTEQMDQRTWQALTSNEKLNQQPVLVNYTLTRQDVSLPYHKKGMQFRSKTEAIAEKFQMSRNLLTKLNPKIALKAGNTITVYNPGQPNTAEIIHLVADKQKNILYAYDRHEQLVASYPTTVGSSRTPSPKGTHYIKSRILNPTYNKDFKNPNTVLPPGPNNPVGRVWMGLSKPSYGIHGSPEPELISRQGSSGCIRLTNWDALSLYGTIQDGASVEFK